MSNFQNLTPTNGFDFEDLNNARQNNYAWSMSELDEYIYVGTGRNILVNIISALGGGVVNLPDLIKPQEGPVNRAEIWRYKKDGSLPWKRVYRAPEGSGIFGFRFMIQHKPFCGSPCIYAAAYGPTVQILKTTNGVDWFIVPNTNLEGTSSRAMVTHHGKVYLATVNELGSNEDPTPLLYSSKDPEFCPWEPIDLQGEAGKNPTGAISNMEVFNNRVYVATSSADGAQVWRTNGSEPKKDDWTLIADKGFGDPANKYTLAIGVFKDYLYVSATKQLPLAWFIPMGCDIIRIDKHDNWDLVVGGNPLIPLPSCDGHKHRSLSGLGSGFNNPFNVYAWQIQEYKGRLFISTFDDSSNMEVILDTLLANRAALVNIIGEPITNLLIGIYEAVLEILKAIKYPYGFDLYVSEDGVNFSSVLQQGLCNKHNYGGRILYVDSCDDLYIGTANPFQGCEVWRTSEIDDSWLQPCDGKHYRNLWKAKKLINEKYSIVLQNMAHIQKLMEKNHYHRFINDDKQ